MEALQNQDIVRRQYEIRHHAEDVKNTLGDLYNWQKEMKEKEQNLKNEIESNDVNSPPIRSHPVITKDSTAEATNNMEKTALSADEKQRKDCAQAEIHKERGNKHVKLGQHELAIKEYTAAIEHFSTDPKFYTNRALCYLKMEKYEECIEDCNRAIDIDNRTVKAYYRRMQANECLGCYSQAFKDCTLVLMIESNNSDAKASLARINKKLKNTGAVPKGFMPGLPQNSQPNGPNFSPLRSNMIDVLPVNKPSHVRSKKSLKKIPIIDVIGPKDGKNFENSNIQISDDVIDKLFNGECGSYEEIKKPIVIEKTPPIKEVKQQNNESSSTSQLVPEPPKKSKIEPSTRVLRSTTALLREKNVPPPPTSTSEFYRNWGDLPEEKRYQYLKSIPTSQLLKIIGAGFDTQQLAEFIKVFKTFYIPNGDDICSPLLEIAKHKNLSILCLFLDTEDKKELAELLHHINKDKEKEHHVQSIKTSFGLESLEI